MILQAGWGQRDQSEAARLAQGLLEDTGFTVVYRQVVSQHPLVPTSGRQFTVCTDPPGISSDCNPLHR